MNDDARKHTLQGLRDLAEFLEAHPNVPLPYLYQLDAFVSSLGDLRTAAQGASWNKVWHDGWFTLQKEFSGGISLHINIARATFCQRRPVGTRVVPAQAEHEETVYEWDCPDLIVTRSE